MVLYLGAAEALHCQTELTNALFSTNISGSTIDLKLKLCTLVECGERLINILDLLSRLETLDPVPNVDCHQIAFISVSGCCRSCAENPSLKGTLLDVILCFCSDS